METGAFTSYFDVAQVVLYLFWIFFAGLILYLHRENKREGYPLESDRSPYIRVQGFPAIPQPKTFKLAHGGSVTVPKPDGGADTREVKAKAAGNFPGAPLDPTGNALLDGVGPGAYAQRADEPDLTIDGHPKIVPLRVATDFSLASNDPDPRGFAVVACDGATAGRIVDAWVDRSETIVRYYEAEVSGGRRVLIPANYARVSGGRREVAVGAINAAQFAHVPATRSPDQVTLLEEDKLVGYFAGGYLYASPDRFGPLL